MFENTEVKPLFELGKVVGTPEAVNFLIENGIDINVLIMRHLTLGFDFELNDEDRKENYSAIEMGSRIFNYTTINGEKIYIITEHENDDGAREYTTIMFANQY